MNRGFTLESFTDHSRKLQSLGDDVTDITKHTFLKICSSLPSASFTNSCRFGEVDIYLNLKELDIFAILKTKIQIQKKSKEVQCAYHT